MFFSNLFNFHGRADRAEFWKINLIVLLIGLLLQLISLSPMGNAAGQIQTYIDGASSCFTALTSLILLALGSRRLHDIGKSGWWQLIMLTGIGIIPLTIWFLRHGDIKANCYGLPTQ